jgi:hypothetical protein
LQYARGRGRGRLRQRIPQRVVQLSRRAMRWHVSCVCCQKRSVHALSLSLSFFAVLCAGSALFCCEVRVLVFVCFMLLACDHELLRSPAFAKRAPTHLLHERCTLSRALQYTEDEEMTADQTSNSRALSHKESADTSSHPRKKNYKIMLET